MNRRDKVHAHVWSNVGILLVMAIIAFGAARGAAGLMLGAGDLISHSDGVAARR